MSFELMPYIEDESEIKNESELVLERAQELQAEIGQLR